MQHSFDIAIAQKYGINVAIFLGNMAFWIQKNVANNKNYHDNHHWTYNSQEAFLQLFPYWSRQALRTVLKKCIDEDLIITGNYNKTQYDRKSWYAFTSRGLDLFPLLKSIGCNQPMERLESTNQLVGINQPIADSKPDKKTERAVARKKRVPLPDDFVLNDQNKSRCKQRGIDISIFTVKFRLKNKGKFHEDWQNQAAIWIETENIEKAANEKIEVVRPILKDFTEERLMREEKQRQSVCYT